MSRPMRWKWTLIFAVVLLSLYAVTGLPRNADELAANLSKNIRLGLDLKGGSHIVLQVQTQDAFKVEADSAIEQIKTILARDGITFVSAERNDPNSVETAGDIAVTISGIDPAKAGDARSAISSALGNVWNVSAAGKDALRLTIKPEAAIPLHQDTLKQTVATIERKIDALGVAEKSVQLRGGTANDAKLLIQLPGVDDPGRVKDVLKTKAMLALREVKDGPFSSREEALTKLGGILPLNTQLVRGRPQGGGETWWLLSRSAVVTGRDLRDARPQDSGTGSWDTNFVLTQDAARRFAAFTGANIGNRLAIVLDDIVLSAPRIDAQIEDQGRIMGARTLEEASDLALNLRAGALPASVRVDEDRTIGPSLGADSIRRGVTAGLVGLALVIASMVLYYRGAGWNAVFALALNTLMTIAALSYLDAAWTLPGIAGLVLSIGMAVDSNVLIFERIKEELRAGKLVSQAIPAGFDRALVTIIDTHVTTVVASLFLFIFGTGPVRGFAVTLVIGLIANLFTAVFVSRVIFDSQLARNARLSHLSGLSGDRAGLLQTTHIDFLSRRKLTLGLSVAAVVLSLASLIVQGGPKYGLDFRGGTMIEVKFNPKPPIDELRQVLASRIPGEFTVQELRDSNEFLIGTGIADEQTLDQVRGHVEQALREKYANLGGRLDLNNASRSALSAIVPSDAVAGAILAYRDKESGGLLPSVDALRSVPGVTDEVVQQLKAKAGVGTFNLRSGEMVGPRAGEQLRNQAVLATACALCGMLAYIAFRFELVSGVVAVLATIHDVIVTLGLFSVFGREINLNIIAALLTLIGYSMNDKIVVFDRVRENMRGRRPAGSFLDLVNLSINQTLSRTLLTAGPTLLACLALYFLGGEVLNGIAFALFAGIIVGTYSSIFVASALLVIWRQRSGRPAPPGAVAAETVARK